MKYFSYDSFRMNYNSVNEIISYFCIFLSITILYKLEKSYGINIPLYIFFISLIVPLSTIFTYEPMNLLFYLTTIFCFNVIIIGLLITPNIDIIYTYLQLIITGGLLRLNFNLSEVYETRELLSENRFYLSGYFIGWIGYTFNPFIIIYGLYNNKKSLIVIGLFYNYCCLI